MSRGLDRERALVTRFRDMGWFAMRSPASKGSVDVLAIPPGERRPWMIEVKSTAAGPFAGFGPADREELRTTATKYGAVAYLVWWPPHRQPRWIHESDWPAGQKPGN